MISTKLAIELRDAGLEWVPTDGDKFAIPDRGLDDQVFSVSEMTIEVRELSSGGRRISFNGAVEWALDSIMQSEVVWLPSEAQLRDRLGSTFRALEHDGDAYICTTSFDGDLETFQADHPGEAYALALLELLSRPDLRLRSMVEGA
jgi:hypothetical protein